MNKIRNKNSKFIWFFVIGIIIGVIALSKLSFNKEEIKMIDLSKKSEKEIKEYAHLNDLKLDIKYEFSNKEKGEVVSQSIKGNTPIKKDQKLIVIISKGIDLDSYADANVNELGKVPIMMYHGIVNKKDDETEYTGGNVDKEGYNRTTESFRRDLEFYYTEGYRMVRLIDYVNGDIDTEFGKSPIVITFDDGNLNNFNVLGKDKKGNLEIDPDCAVGILESFKGKYKDYKVTATFFLNKGLFNQKEYDEEKLKWLVDNGYDVGNHTKTHVNFKSINIEKTQEEVGYMYEKLNSIIGNKYVPIIALPFGSPGNKEHENFPYILKGTYNNKEYNTLATIRVGWEPNYSPYSKKFDKEFLKRVRAWDNNGKEFDIDMVFNALKDTKYISDGNKDTIGIPDNSTDYVNETNKKIIEY